MEHTLDKISSKPTDYKLCSSCGNLNWYENEECWVCNNNVFENDINAVNEFIEDEMSFYREHYDTTDFRSIKINI